MKKLTSLGLVTAGLITITGCVTEVPVAQAPPPPPPPVVAVAPDLSPAASEVLRLTQASTTEEVILAYVQNSASPFALNSDQILLLRNNGVSSAVITAMLNRDSALRQYAAPVAPPPQQVVVTPPPVATPPPVYVSSPPPDVAYFYDQLSPYGTWVQVDGIGWCWQPRVVVTTPTWRPYCDGGHWLYTDAGWYWQSDYSWGWAPFHYGRWQMHERCGWVWVPDRVWGPSWVVWRTENDHCGWAPLPPHADYDIHSGWYFNGVSVAVNFDFGLHPDHFTFVRFGDFTAHDLGHRRLERPQVTRIYNNTTIINNYVVNNNTIINQGVRVERVSQATHTDLHRVPVHSAPAPTAVAGRVNQPAREDVVYRTELKPPAKPVASMVAQRIDDRHPVVAHNDPGAKPMNSREVPQHQPAVASRPAPAPDTQSSPTAAPAMPAPAPVATAQPSYKPEPVAPAVRERPGNRTSAPGQVASRPVDQNQPVTRNPSPQPAASRTVEPPKPVTRTTTAFLPAPKPAAAVPAAPVARNVPFAAPAGSPAATRQAYPLQISMEKPVGAQITPEGQNTHVYEPKSARQASEAHALPSANPRSATPKAVPARNPKGQQKKTE